MASLLREPLVQFVAIAALVFAAYQALGGEGAPDRTLRLSAAEVARLAALYQSEAGVAPDAEELRRIVADHVETAALAAEARRLRLDEGDAVVERRLAQKMRFTLSDLGEIRPPADADLRVWASANASRFQRGARLSFDQIYFRDAGDPRLEEARAALMEGEADWRRLGDPFILGRQAGELPLREIARRYGREFANAVAPLDSSATWRGPIASAFGAHLVRITAKIGGEAPEYAAIRETARSMWIEEERRRRAAEAVAALVGRYKVVIETGEGE